MESGRSKIEFRAFESQSVEMLKVGTHVNNEETISKQNAVFTNKYDPVRHIIMPYDRYLFNLYPAKVKHMVSC
jgi:hypothetical protein